MKIVEKDIFPDIRPQGKLIGTVSNPAIPSFAEACSVDSEKASFVITKGAMSR